MAVRERFHREVFIGEWENDVIQLARDSAERLASSGWEYHNWFWSDKEEDFPGERVLVLWLKWSGPQQDQEALLDEKPTSWATSTTALPTVDVERERRLAGVESDVKRLMERFDRLEQQLRIVAPATVITGEFEPVSPGPREWAGR